MTKNQKEEKSLINRVLIEFGPILVFISLFEINGFFFATAGMIVTVLMSILYLYVTEKTIPLFTVLVSLITLSFALLTILLHSPKILIFRDTFYDYFFAAAIFIGLYNKKYFLKKIFSHVVQLTDKGWRTASYAWGIYFLIMGTLNEIIREYGTEVLWINFKIWVVVATLGLSALLTLYLKEERIVK